MQIPPDCRRGIWIAIIKGTGDLSRATTVFCLRPSGVASLRAVYFRDELEGWAVGMFGVIMQTTDGGKIWKRQKSPSGAALYDKR
jgi:photosystem II stability/assembly factor-like uncharacterized protein